MPLLFVGITCTDENLYKKRVRLGARPSWESRSWRRTRRLDYRRIGGCPGEDDSDFGSCEPGSTSTLPAIYPWSQYYNMYSFVTQELPEAVMVACPEVDETPITGTAMGGHGALTIGLKQPALWRSVSAFSPICNPTKVPWAPKRSRVPRVRRRRPRARRLRAREEGPRSDAILVSQGADDDFLVGDTNQLQPARSVAGGSDGRGGAGAGSALREAGLGHHSFLHQVVHRGDHRLLVEAQVNKLSTRSRRRERISSPRLEVLPDSAEGRRNEQKRCLSMLFDQPDGPWPSPSRNASRGEAAAGSFGGLLDLREQAVRVGLAVREQQRHRAHHRLGVRARHARRTASS